MPDSKDIILKNIQNALGVVKTDYEYADSLFKEDGLISEFVPEQLINEFSEKLESLSGHAELIENDNNLIKFIEKIFGMTKSSSFFGWDNEYLIPSYEKLEEKGYRRTKSTGKISQSKCDIGITLADYAISETGSIVLYTNRVQNRNASLIVPIHIAILPKENLVKNIFDLFVRIINDYSELEDVRELSSCVSFITGPSRTADIELNLTLGVHGPKELYVLII